MQYKHVAIYVYNSNKYGKFEKKFKKYEAFCY